MGRYINLFTDFGFKKIFGSEENKDILLDFLNTLLADKQTITDLKFLNSERLGNSILERKAIFDLYCENDKGEKFIVELQRAKQEYFKERSIYYATRAYPPFDFPPNGGTQGGLWQAVYTIAIMDFEFSGMGHNNVKSDVILYDQENQQKFSDKLRFIYLEMPKFQKTEEELETNNDKWLYLLKNISELEKIPNRLQKVLFEKVFQMAEVSNYKRQDRLQYEQSLKEYRDYYNTIATAEKDAKKEGRIERNIEVAKNALQKGLDTSLIMDLTGLTLEEIDKLKNGK